MAFYQNPANGYIEQGSTALSWLGCLIFGPLYLALSGLWAGACFSFVLLFLAAMVHWVVAVILGVILNILFAMSVYDMLDKKYLRMGWIKVKREGLKKSQQQGKKKVA